MKIHLEIIVAALLILWQEKCSCTYINICQTVKGQEIDCTKKNLTTVPHIVYPYNKTEGQYLYVRLSFNKLTLIPRTLYNTMLLQKTANNMTKSLCANSLDFSHILIEKIEKGAFEGENSCLYSLDLGHNKLKTLPLEGVQTISLLFTLKLSSNNFQSITTDSFRNLTNLRSLYLDNCKIQTIQPYTFKRLIDVKLIDLSKNLITHLEQNTFSGIQNPKLAINLSYMTINGIVKEVFNYNNNTNNKWMVKREETINATVYQMQNGSNVKKINVQPVTPEFDFESDSAPQCRGAFEQNGDIYAWQASNFSYHHDTESCAADQIKGCTWSISCTGFTDVPKVILNGNVNQLGQSRKYDYTNITFEQQSLEFLGNNFQTLQDNLFTKRLTQIFGKTSDSNPTPICMDGLHFGNNNLTHISNNAFLGEPGCLQHLDLSRNHSTELPIKALQSLKALTELNLRRNNFGTIKANSFANLSLLETLCLERCKINTLEPMAFQGLDKLKKLLLGGNSISMRLTHDALGLPSSTEIHYDIDPNFIF